MTIRDDEAVDLLTAAVCCSSFGACGLVSPTIYSSSLGQATQPLHTVCGLSVQTYCRGKLLQAGCSGRASTTGPQTAPTGAESPVTAPHTTRKQRQWQAPASRRALDAGKHSAGWRSGLLCWHRLRMLWLCRCGVGVRECVRWGWATCTGGTSAPELLGALNAIYAHRSRPQQLAWVHPHPSRLASSTVRELPHDGTARALTSDGFTSLPSASIIN